MSDSIQTIPVRTAPGYTVSIGPGLLTSCGQRLREVLGPCRAAVIADSSTPPPSPPVSAPPDFPSVLTSSPQARPTRISPPSRRSWSSWPGSI